MKVIYTVLGKTSELDAFFHYVIHQADSVCAPKVCATVIVCVLKQQQNKNKLEMLAQTSALDINSCK